MGRERKLYLFLIILLLAIGILVFVLNNYTQPISPKLRIVGCDVGQGDALLVSYGKNQILIDGGPNSSVLECLQRHMRLTDRKIELVILSHPQFDHYRGLIDVFDRYHVENFVASGLDSDAAAFEELEKLVAREDTHLIRPDEGTKIKMGEVVVEIIHPSTEFQEEYKIGDSKINDPKVLGMFDTKEDPNDFSVAGYVVFKNFELLFTGDLGPDTSDKLVTQGKIKDVELLKVNHHGSKNGLTQELFAASNPEAALIMAGKDNRFGHPHQEILNILKDIKIYRTDIDGEVVFESDGFSLWVKK